jgi:hypothetical protein
MKKEKKNKEVNKLITNNTVVKSGQGLYFGFLATVRTSLVLRGTEHTSGQWFSTL